MKLSRVLDVGFGGLAAAQLGAALWLSPAADGVTRPDGSPLGALCWVHAAFGIDCPMCGMTRSFVALAHGHVREAFAFHAAGPLLFVAMIALVVAVAVVTIKRATPLVERPRFQQIFQTVAYACLAVGVIHMVRS